MLLAASDAVRWYVWPAAAGADASATIASAT